MSVHSFQNGGYVNTGVELWDLASASRRRVLQQRPWAIDTERNTGQYVVGSLEFSPDGKSMVATDGQGFVLWNLEAGTEKFRFRSGVFDPGLSPGWSPDGKLLALPSMEQEKFALTNGVAIIDVSNGKRTAFFPVELGYARTARFSPDGRLLATAGHDCTVRAYDVKNGRTLFEDPTGGTMFAVAFDPSGREIVAGPTWGGALLIYEVNWAGGKPAVNKKGLSAKTGEEIHLVEFAPDGARAFTSSQAGVRLWEKNWRRSKVLMGCKGRLANDGRQFAVVREDAKNVVEIWRLEDFASVRRGEEQ